MITVCIIANSILRNIQLKGVKIPNTNANCPRSIRSFKDVGRRRREWNLGGCHGSRPLLPTWRSRGGLDS